MRSLPSPRKSRTALGSAALLLAFAAPGVAGAQSEPDPDASDELQIASISAPSPQQTQRLADLGLDVIAASDDEVQVLVHAPADKAALRRAGVSAQFQDTRAQQAAMTQARKAEARLQAQVDADPTLGSDLPTGRVSYRTLEEVQEELRQIAAAYPDRVQLFELPHTSLLGQPVLGIEITRDVGAESGKPVFLTTGVHHAREWPTVELTMEFAWDVLDSDGTDPEVTDLLASSRLMIVPAVNPDGYDLSRERVIEQKRKNCRVEPGDVPTYEECAAAESLGVDLNRNYGAWWGGPGSSGSPTAGNHHGAGPYSEPEIQNMSHLINTNQVTVAVHNHTPDARLLRAPSSPLEPEPAEVELYDSLAQQLGEDLSWPAGPWTEIYYNASGVGEQEGLYVTGTLGFTPELTPGHSGLQRFHPPYEYVIDQYDGTGFYEESSWRDMIMTAWQASADPDYHGVIVGNAPAGIELTISKDVTVDSSPLDLAHLPEIVTSEHELTSTMRVPQDGQFSWHVNPSYRQSQQDSTLLKEAWTISCANPAGKVHHEVEVEVGRGEVAEVDLSACPRGPKTSPPGRN